jgi:hypothetical protein
MEDYYRHWLPGHIYTAGIKYTADTGHAYWLIDAIVSHQGNPKARAEEFQVWILRVDLQKHTAILTMTDGNTDKPIIEQAIPYTDYPDDYFEAYLVRTPGSPAVLMLTTEY